MSIYNIWRLRLLTVPQLSDLIASEREKGKAFLFVAEAARHELARRGEQA